MIPLSEKPCVYSHTVYGHRVSANIMVDIIKKYEREHPHILFHKYGWGSTDNPEISPILPSEGDIITDDTCEWIDLVAGDCLPISQYISRIYINSKSYAFGISCYNKDIPSKESLNILKEYYTFEGEPEKIAVYDGPSPYPEDSLSLEGWYFTKTSSDEECSLDIDSIPIVSDEGIEDIC